MKKFSVLIILIIFLIILGTVWLGWKEYQKTVKGVLVSTDQREYSQGENPKIKIKNILTKTVCFSSCFPYYLEKNNGPLESYHYGGCSFPDLAEICIEPGRVKAFELLLDKIKVEKGIHRVALPACVGCSLEENFRKDKFFYSNKFIIK